MRRLKPPPERAGEGKGFPWKSLIHRTLYPLDKQMIFSSVEKTTRVVIATEEVKRGSFAGELAAMISRILLL